MTTYEENQRAAVAAYNAQLASALGQAMARAQHQRRTYTEQLDEQSVRNGDVQGFAEIDGSGEVLVKLRFPVSFMEKPLFTYGFELGENQSVETRAFPMPTAVVVGWDTRLVSSKQTLYNGATVGIVIMGPSELKMILHYRFAGQSFTNPVGPDTSVTGSL